MISYPMIKKVRITLKFQKKELLLHLGQ